MASTPQQQLAATWDTLAHKILASILVDNGAVFPVLDVLGTGMHWWPPKAAQAWAGVIQCVNENVPPTVEAVKLRSGCDNGYLRAIANGWNDDDNSKVVYHAGELKRMGALAELRRLGRELCEVIDPSAVTSSIGFAENRLRGLTAVTSDRKGDAASVSASAWNQVEQFQGQGIMTGLGWLDDITGGLWPGWNVWLAGAYKSGKTTLMRNFLLHTLDQGYGADAYCAEGTREMFTLDCQAMIATRLLCERGIRRLDKLRLSGLFLLRVWRDRLPVLTKDELDAVNDAREIWEGYNVRVWDTRDGIRDLTTLHHRVRQSNLEFGSMVHWADYSQLFAPGKGTIYERQSETSMAVEEIAVEAGVVFGMLTQRNEASIRDGGGYSAGVKGGGDASAAADLMLIPMIDHELKDRIKVRIKHARHAGVGEGIHVINASSGLIVDRWFKAGAQPLDLEPMR